MSDIFEVIQPTLRLSSFFGLAPFKIDKEEKQLKTSIPWVVYGSLLLLIFCGNAGYSLYAYFAESSSEEHGMFMSSANRICQFGCGIMVTIGVIIMPFLQREKYILLFRGFYDIAQNMALINLHIPLTNIKRNSTIYMISIIVGVILLLIHDVSLCDGIGIEKFYDWITYYVPNFYNYLMELQFVLAALLLRKNFIKLNDYLITLNGPIDEDEFNIKENSVSSIENLTTILVRNNKSTEPPIDPFLGWDGSFPRLRIKEVQSWGVEQTQKKLDNLKVFRKLHNSLCDLKENLNSAFSLQLLTCVAQAFVVITSNLFLLFTILSDSTKRASSCLSYPIIWVLIHVFELIIVVVTCTKTCKAANRTAIVVHKLLARDCEPVIRNQVMLYFNTCKFMVPMSLYYFDFISINFSRLRTHWSYKSKLLFSLVSYFSQSFFNVYKLSKKSFVQIMASVYAFFAYVGIIKWYLTNHYFQVFLFSGPKQ